MIIPFFLERRWWERPYIDMWSIPHALMGVLVAAVTSYWVLNAWLGASAVVVIALAWEGFEHLTGISDVEPLTNRVTDIVIACTGYGLGVIIFQILPDDQTFKWVIIGILAVDAVLTSLGIISYRLFVFGKKFDPDRENTQT